MSCTIRPWRLSDAKDLASALSNRNILNNLRDGLPFPYTEKDAEDYIRAMLSSDPQHTFAYAVCLGEKAVGSIGAFRQGNIHARTAELGYYLAEECWGKGIMTEAVRQLCEKIFAETDILRIFAEPFAYNTGSRRVLEKAGFRLEGILKSNACKNGKVVDMALYALTKSEGLFAVRRLGADEIPAALALAKKVFLQFEAPVYSKEGTDFFCKNLADPAWIRQQHFYGAFDGDSLVGMLSMRTPRHISGFFVLPAYQRKGIGRALFSAMRKDYDTQAFTVNASPYALEIYKHLGFTPTGKEQTLNGLRFTPMRFSEE